MARYREHPSAALCLGSKAMGFKKADCLQVGEIIKCTVEEFLVAQHMPEQILRFTGICQVAPAFPGNINFLPKLLIFFQQEDFVPAGGGMDGCHHACCPSAYYNYFTHNFYLYFLKYD